MEAVALSSPRKQGSMRQQGSEHRPQSGLGKGHGELEAEVEEVEGGQMAESSSCAAACSKGVGG